MKSPLASVKEKFGDKKQLVDAIEKLTGEELWLGRTSKEKGLGHVSNAKLLKLHATFTTVKEKFGTRAKLIDAIADLEKRAKDEGYKSRIGAYPVPRLWDLYQSIEKRGLRAKKSAELLAKKGVKQEKKAAAKAPAAKKTATVKKTPAAKTAKPAKK
jgi:hypothetical protein